MVTIAIMAMLGKNRGEDAGQLRGQGGLEEVAQVWHPWHRGHVRSRGPHAKVNQATIVFQFQGKPLQIVSMHCLNLGCVIISFDKSILSQETKASS